MVWFLDFEAHHIESYDCRDFGKLRYIVKEMTILSGNGKRCYNYFVRNPCKLSYMPDTETAHFQFQHMVCYGSLGTTLFESPIKDIDRKVGEDVVYVKELQKTNFIKEYLLNVIELEGLPPLKTLNNYMNERCEVKHGNHCARRKVYELRHAYAKTKQLTHLL